MKNCNQTDTQTVYEHGLSVWKYTQKILNKEWDELNIPEWFKSNFDKIKSKLYDVETIKEYNIFHDCGKPYCIEIDDEGKRHFPNHAKVSKDIWDSISDNKIVSELISLDMMLHTETADEIINRDLSTSTLCTLLVTAFAEIHSNAEMFGGINSTSFKIKHKKICKRGKMIVRRYL